MNTLNFNGKIYELIEVVSPKFRVYDPEAKYEDIAFLINNKPFNTSEGVCINIKGKFYAPKLIENEYTGTIKN
jgi:hypothetical protein